ncbi:MtrB/PioB family outer membrane beta-barrel protein [Stenotrophomonas sp. MH1]|uniref:MtrB/PioB family outer membrane beta-barrel protein n=1 Tax=Stenotrophomonas capsici TaxID=3110230 RepID=A0ABU5V0H9_9GAMM|nr:MtrB/PioB family outer membrane beta-barrel protein [Stenotrophomonas sp. MH1]MEA5666672.1 MtrB/PioB family outer membrane beta-barrel protein [Stenotrophomonas sp. MH1]
MCTRKRSRTCRWSLLSLALLGGLAQAQDSGAGIDLQFGNWLDPSGRIGWDGCDPDGASWLSAEPKRTPTGFLYGCAPHMPAEKPLGDNGWTYSGNVGLGYLHVSGDEANTHWRRFRDPDDGLILQANFSLKRAADGSYADVRLSRLERDNQYYRAVFGQAGRYKVQAFVRSTPNVLSGNARSIWDGVGSAHLTLKHGLTAAGSTPAQVAALSAAQPFTTLSVVRDKQGVSINYLLNPRWTGYASLTHEERKGARPFGGPFFFNYPFPANGGIYEIPRPIDDSTMNVTGGFRFVGNVWRSDFNYTGSFFRNAHSAYDYQVPYGLYSVAGASTPALYSGSFAYEPENDYHRLGVTVSRKLPAWNGDFSLAMALTTMRQNDRLQAPMDCQGQFGQNLAPPFIFDCANWNTTDALSRKRADLAINNQKLDARLVLLPSDKLTWRSTGRYLREDYAGTYWAYNPLTGQYGYIAENGAQGSVVPGEMGVWDPGANASVLTRIRNLPLDKETHELSSGVDYRLDNRNTLSATYTFTRIERAHREIATTRDNMIKLGWNNRTLDWLTLRANYTYLDRSGSQYYYDPYAFTFSSSLPGFTGEDALSPHTVSALRKYDIASRTQQKLDLMATFILPRDMTVYASFRGDRNHYDAQIGRQRLDTYASSLQWEWQPNPATTTSAWIGHDRSTLDVANVNDATGTDPALGGVTYPDANRWWMSDTQRNHYAGLNLTRRIGRATLELAWNWTYSKGRTRYRMASPDALTVPANAAQASGGYPLMVYRVNSLTAGLSVPLNERMRLRFFDTWERGNLSDWHYFGFEDTLVYDHRVYTDGGPSSYKVNQVGMLFEVAL